MSDPAILFCKPGAVKPADKKALKTAGVLVIEIEDPQSVKFTRAHAEIDGCDLLRVAMQTINETKSFQNVREAFGANIANFLAGK